ncbi:MAG: ABC transporter ATP-binding protein [Candidatus Omnitrophota bacterium]
MDLLKLIKYPVKYRKLFLLQIAFTFISLPLSLLNPFLTKLIVDKAYAHKDLGLFFVLVLLSAGILVFNSLLNTFGNYLLQKIKSLVNFDMTMDIFRHIQSLPVGFFKRSSAGEHIYKITGDVRSVAELICEVLPQAVELLLRLFLITAIIFYLDLKIGLFLILLAPLAYLHLRFFGRWLKANFQRSVEKSESIFVSLHEVFSHINLIKAFGKEKLEAQRLQENFAKATELDLKNQRLLAISSFSNFLMNNLFSGLIVLYGGYQVIQAGMSLGSLTAVAIYTFQLVGIAGSISNLYQSIKVNSVSQKRLLGIFSIKAEVCDQPDASTVAKDSLRGAIEFKDVLFRYGNGPAVFNKINFTIPAKAKIALVGPSGCGKTTLLSLMMRFYDPASGGILIDGQDIRKIKLDSLRPLIGIVFEESSLWNDTVANNLRYGAFSASLDQAIQAAKLSQAHGFIMGLEQGYDTLVGENACNISEGQKQRIAIGRALIKQPLILLLDEAMSSLDSQTEDKLIDNLKRELKDSTVIVVSHRLSTVKKMDAVCFLSSASGAVCSSHEELLNSDPAYRALFASQTQDI